MSLFKLCMVLSLFLINISIFSSDIQISDVQVLAAMTEKRRTALKVALINFQNDSSKDSAELEKIKSECHRDNQYVLPGLAKELCHPDTKRPSLNSLTLGRYCAVMSMSQANESFITEIDKALGASNKFS